MKSSEKTQTSARYDLYPVLHVRLRLLSQVLMSDTSLAWYNNSHRVHRPGCPISSSSLYRSLEIRRVDDVSTDHAEDCIAEGKVRVEEGAEGGVFDFLGTGTARREEGWTCTARTERVRRYDMKGGRGIWWVRMKGCGVKEMYCQQPSCAHQVELVNSRKACRLFDSRYDSRDDHQVYG